MLFNAKDSRSSTCTMMGGLPAASSRALRSSSTASACSFSYIRTVASRLVAMARSMPGSIVPASASRAPALAVLPARKWFSAAFIRRSTVSPPSPRARSTSSAAAAGAPRDRAESAAWSSAVRISSSPCAAANAR